MLEADDDTLLLYVADPEPIVRQGYDERRSIRDIIEFVEERMPTHIKRHIKREVAGKQDRTGYASDRLLSWPSRLLIFPEYVRLDRHLGILGPLKFVVLPGISYPFSGPFNESVLIEILESTFDLFF